MFWMVLIHPHIWKKTYGMVQRQSCARRRFFGSSCHSPVDALWGRRQGPSALWWRLPWSKAGLPGVFQPNSYRGCEYQECRNNKQTRGPWDLSIIFHKPNRRLFYKWSMLTPYFFHPCLWQLYIRRIVTSLQNGCGTCLRKWLAPIPRHFASSDHHFPRHPNLGYVGFPLPPLEKPLNELIYSRNSLKPVPASKNHLFHIQFLNYHLNMKTHFSIHKIPKIYH